MSSAQTPLSDLQLAIWVTIIALLIIVAFLFCCDKGSRESLRTHPPQDIETGRPSNNQATQRQPPASQQAAAVPVLAGTIVIYKDGETKSNCADCAICLEELKDGDKCRVPSKCKHIYHKLCIDKWLVKDTHCPLCRASVHDSEPTTQIVNTS
ncbi:hypothetical protein QUC31_003966 [Theobroma cacao]